ncbi:uncharacterized protein [Phyllobates terribilis]|uniref:uncharacterized protein n=1 Tax=Phyllobates terribilis TaxID=111132 RepID=UPI003CCA6EBD
MEFVRNMERRRLIKPQDILATLQSIPEDESESELQEHVFDSDSDEDFIPQNISSESEDSEGTNPEDIPSTSTGDRAHAVMLPRDHPPGRGQKKSAKRPRNERTTDNDGGEGNATTNTREGESEGILVSADGIQWKPVEIGEHLPGRRDSQNILREAPGPTGYARRNIIIDSPLSVWRLFFDSYILTHIKNCTLAEACRNNNLQFTLSDEELDAFIAIFYARGISGTNRHSISSIWCNDWGIPFCKATMSRDRFVEIMRFLRFDEKSTRSERLQTDKFALFSTVWDRFIENCIACYKPGPYITVVEQLFPSKTRCPFTQYMPSKPDKYGHKYWLAVDKRSKYLANGFPYLGKDDTRRAEDRLADHVVMKLLDPFLKKVRNVTTDNYFTSVKLAKQLKSKGTTIVGTLNKIRREVPKEIKSMKEELYNTKVFRNEDNFTLTVYQGKPNKNVVILSSVHPDVVVASDSAKKTPETVKFYNETKYGVDVVDQMARKYTTRTCTRRWPVHAFENALDFAGINAWIIFKEITHQKMSRKAFLQTLVRELSGPYVTDREKGSTSQVSTCSEVMVQTKFCQIKEKCKKNRSVGNCKTCEQQVQILLSQLEGAASREVRSWPPTEKKTSDQILAKLKDAFEVTSISEVKMRFFARRQQPATSSEQWTIQHAIRVLVAQQKFSNSKGEICRVRIRDIQPVIIQPSSETMVWCRARLSIENLRLSDSPQTNPARRTTISESCSQHSQLSQLSPEDIISSEVTANQHSTQAAQDSKKVALDPWQTELNVGDATTSVERINGVMNIAKQYHQAFNKHPLDFGQLPSDLAPGVQVPDTINPFPQTDWVIEHRRCMAEAKEIVDSRMEEARRRQQEDYNQHAHAKPLQIGDRVWLRNNHRTGKLDLLWEVELYTIAAIPFPSSDVYEKSKIGWKRQTVHRNGLKLCLKYGHLHQMPRDSIPTMFLNISHVHILRFTLQLFAEDFFS